MKVCAIKRLQAKAFRYEIKSMIFIIIYIALILSGVLFRWPSGSKSYTFIVSLLLAIMVGVSTTHADYAAYFSTYQTVTISSALGSPEPLWMILNLIGRTVGLPYRVFAMVISIMSSTYFAFSAKRISNNTPLFLALLLIYPGTMNLVQFRQYVATAVLFGAFVQLIIDNTVSGKFRFVVQCLAAALIHSYAIIFVFVLFAAYMFKHIKVYRIFMATIIFVGLFSNIFQELAQSIFTSSVEQAYFMGEGGRPNDLSRYFTIMEMIVACGISVAAKRSLRKLELEIKDAAIVNRLADYTIFLSFLFVALIPVFLYNTDFLRLHRYSLPLIALLVCKLTDNSVRAPIQDFILRCVVLAFYCLLFYGLVWRQAAETAVIPFFPL